MSEPLSLLVRQGSLKLKRRSAFIAIVAVAGLVAGFFTACLDYPMARIHREHEIFARCALGAPLGLALAISLASCGVLRGFGGLCRAISFVPLSCVSYFAAFWVAVYTELLVNNSMPMSGAQSNSALSMFAGGFVGGFLILDGVPILVDPKEMSATRFFKVFGASLICGTLGIVGWMLGPYLGIHVWSVVHTLGLRPDTETFQNAQFDVSRTFSLFVVWQTGTALLLGLILRSVQSRSISGTATQ